jgi:hypothetical protein
MMKSTISYKTIRKNKTLEQFAPKEAEEKKEAEE